MIRRAIVLMGRAPRVIVPTLLHRRFLVQRGFNCRALERSANWHQRARCEAGVGNAGAHRKQPQEQPKRCPAAWVSAVAEHRVDQIKLVTEVSPGPARTC